jgi:hypothetical protein
MFTHCAHGYRAQFLAVREKHMLTPPSVRDAKEKGEREHSEGGKPGTTAGPLGHLIQVAAERALTDKAFTVEPIIGMPLRTCRRSTLTRAHNASSHSRISRSAGRCRLNLRLRRVVSRPGCTGH